MTAENTIRPFKVGDVVRVKCKSGFHIIGIIIKQIY